MLLLPIKKGIFKRKFISQWITISFHKNASNKTSDKLGRISNLQNTHIVDSSVLPDINTGPGVGLITNCKQL